MTRALPLRATATGLALGATALSVAFAPAALAYTLAAVTAPASVVAGTPFTISGTQCDPDPQPGSSNFQHYVTITTDSTSQVPAEVLFGAQPTSDGTWSAQVSFPAGTPAGEHHIDIDCSTSYIGEERVHDYPLVSLTVSAPGGTTTTPPATPTTATPTTATPSTPAATPSPSPIRGTSANTPGVAASASTNATDDKLAAPGQKVVRVLTGFQPNEVVTVTLHSTPQVVGTYKADGQGVLTIEFAVPAGTPVGDHTLVYAGTTTYFQESFEVSANGKAGGSLAYTGASIALPLTLGAGLLAVGGGVLVATRRRSSGASQA